MDNLQFTIPEILSLIGVTQCVYILVYITFRAGRLSRAGLPILYFSILSIAFFLDAARTNLGEITPWYDELRWFFWFSGPPVSVLLLIQIAQITQVPPLRHFWVLLLTPLALGISLLLTQHTSECEALHTCPELREWLIVTGLIAGGVSLLTIWLKRGIFAEVTAGRAGKERYWLILALIFANIIFLGVMLASLGPLPVDEAWFIRTVLGLGLVYLANTSLFRIYPQAVRIENRQSDKLSDEDRALALKIEKLINMDKVYHEAAYSRSDLAQELGKPETTVSRVINMHFGKSFPQLVNERRVADAQRMLVETKVSVKVIAQEVGFNSLASFNRVFKDMAGKTPSEYRKTRTS
jgi:AraC-like DNA-binding protein